LKSFEKLIKWSNLEDIQVCDLFSFFDIYNVQNIFELESSYNQIKCTIFPRIKAHRLIIEDGLNVWLYKPMGLSYRKNIKTCQQPRAIKQVTHACEHSTSKI